MGSWGIGITSDDTVRDIIDFLSDQLKSGKDLISASNCARKHFAELEHDDDERPLLFLALAYVQWKYGEIEDKILEQVRNDIKDGAGLARWEDDPNGLNKRQKTLENFLAKIEVPNPKPSKPPKVIFRPALFKTGDCLEIVLSDGRYSAALVLGTDDSNLEYGKNWIASLDFISHESPTLNTFKKKKWLVLKHGSWKNQKDIWWYLGVHFKKESHRIRVVGNISLGWFLPKPTDSFAGWHHLGEQILLVHQSTDRDIN